MRRKGIQFATGTLATSLGTVSCLALDANKPLTPTAGLPAIAEVFNSWPWLASAAIVLLLGVIALAARRRLPFGPRS
jgi:hypothetical protein